MGAKVYLIALLILAVILVVSFATFLILRRRRNRLEQNEDQITISLSSGTIPSVSREIRILDVDRNLEEMILNRERSLKRGASLQGGSQEKNGSDGGSGSSSSVVPAGDQVQGSIGWGRWYSFKELERATQCFASENVVGEGGYGIVYRGVLEDGAMVAVKSLRSNNCTGKVQKEFEVEVEAIGRVRHKNLVGFMGYCAEGDQRMLVYEYVDNGNLAEWLHGEVGSVVSPLSWDIRMKIAIGTAKGLAYLHEALEPRVIHRDVKSSNILLDKSWNAKVSDFGLAKLLVSDAAYVATRVMGTFGYLSPDYASTGMLNEASDVYSFGVLLMELITGRSPIDFTRPPGEINLVDWFRGMVASRRGEDVLDPVIITQPSPRALKRVLLVCLRCIDVDLYRRPKMGQIVHMLEADELSFRLDSRQVRELNLPSIHYQ